MKGTRRPASRKSLANAAKAEYVASAVPLEKERILPGCPIAKQRRRKERDTFAGTGRDG